LNEALESSSVPLEVVDGFIHEISISVPWTCLIQKSTELEITGLELTLQPKQISQNGNLLTGIMLFVQLQICFYRKFKIG
jgi:autophagy-related protein 2